MSEADWHPKGFQAYIDSNYDYDDAELLAQLWNIPISEAKQAIGHKILNGIEDLLPSKVAPDNTVDAPKVDWDGKALDTFFNSQFTYDDAARLSQLWGQADAYAGKKLIGATMISGNSKMIDQLLKGPTNAGNENSVETWLNAFFNSNYTYDDADLLSQLWGLGSAYEGKKLIGAKLVNGLESILPDKIRRGGGSKVNPDDKAYDAFFNSEYTYADADLLSQLWNISLGEAKKTIGTKVINGIDQLLPMDVRRPRG